MATGLIALIRDLYPVVPCAMYQYWQKEFGAEIVGVSGDVIECIVKNPPRDKETAIKLVWQQYWYCTDIVAQGCETIANLAVTLLNAEVWYFGGIEGFLMQYKMHFDKMRPFRVVRAAVLACPRIDGDAVFSP